LAEVAKLKEELSNQKEEFAKRIEACKLDDAQAFLMGSEATIEHVSGLHRTIDFSELGPSKTMVNDQLVEE